MDAFDPHRRDNSIVSEHRLPVETTNDQPEVEPPVFRLPTELTVQIFRECVSDIRLRLTLTHTCHRWRQIAVNYASLWTDILICTIPKPKIRLDCFLSLLHMQIDRAADLLLDVKWIADIKDEFFIATLQIIREKAPFSRWRSLDVNISHNSRDDNPWSAAPWSTADAFTNLEFLIVRNRSDNAIISVIDRTIASRLKALEVEWNYPSAETIATSFAKSFTLITSLRLDSLFPGHYGPFLPANVVNLELDTGVQHPFPHIQTYTLRHCIFTEGNTVDLRNLTTLVVTMTLMVRLDCHVLLPALHELKLGSLIMGPGAKISAPVLDILYFMTPSGFGVNDDTALLSKTDWSLQHRGYLLSPNTSVIADSYLPSSTIIHLLARSPKVTHVILRFDSWTDAQAVLGRMVEFEAERDSSSVENAYLCPRLSELRLDFHWEFSEPSASNEWLLNGLKARSGSVFLSPLTIYVRWKGEGGYALLTSD